MIDSIQIIPVVETNEATQSDNKYILKYLSLYHGKVLQTNRVVYRNFVYANGKNNMTSLKVEKQIKQLTNAFDDKTHKSFVVYFIDTDKFGNEEKQKLDDLLAFCSNKGYIPVLFSYEIEDVFGVDIVDHSKKKTSELFMAKHHNKDSFNQIIFSKDINFVRSHKGFSNLELVLKEIIALLSIE